VIFISRVKDVPRVYGKKDSSFSVAPEAHSRLYGITGTEEKRNFVTTDITKLLFPKGKDTLKYLLFRLTLSFPVTLN